MEVKRHKNFSSAMKYFILNAFLIISVRSIEIPVKKSYIGKCTITECETFSVPDGKCVTFVCVESSIEKNYFDNSPNLQCSHATNQTIRKDDIVQMNFQDCSISSIGGIFFEVYKKVGNCINLQ